MFHPNLHTGVLETCRELEYIYAKKIVRQVCYLQKMHLRLCNKLLNNSIMLLTSCSVLCCYILYENIGRRDFFFTACL